MIRFCHPSPEPPGSTSPTSATRFAHLAAKVAHRPGRPRRRTRRARNPSASFRAGQTRRKCGTDENPARVAQSSAATSCVAGCAQEGYAFRACTTRCGRGEGGRGGFLRQPTNLLFVIIIYFLRVASSFQNS